MLQLTAPCRPGCQTDPRAFHGPAVGGAAQGAAQGVASMWHILLSAHLSYKIRISKIRKMRERLPHACLPVLMGRFKKSSFFEQLLVTNLLLKSECN